MTEKEWKKIIEDMNREDSNASRRYRLYNLSLDWMRPLAYRIDDETDLKERMESAMKKLTWKQRRVLKLIYFHGYSQVEVAKMLKCNESSVSRLKKRALDSLWKILNS